MSITSPVDWRRRWRRSPGVLLRAADALRSLSTGYSVVPGGRVKSEPQVASRARAAARFVRLRQSSWQSRSETMLAESQVASRLPVRDLARARKFYSQKLGLEPTEERPGGLLYRCGSGYFALFESAG